jgi:hypothetical protein
MPRLAYSVGGESCGKAGPSCTLEQYVLARLRPVVVWAAVQYVFITECLFSFPSWRCWFDWFRARRCLLRLANLNRFRCGLINSAAFPWRFSLLTFESRSQPGLAFLVRVGLCEPCRTSGNRCGFDFGVSLMITVLLPNKR